MSGHTPGPWYSDGLPWSRVSSSINHEFIAEVRDEHDGRLIAAAPELLAALEAMRDQFQYTSINDGDDEANRLAQAAIAKATT